MNILKSIKGIGNEVGKGFEAVAEKASDAFDNLASHLPFSNIAKKEDRSFHLEVDLPGVKKEDIEIKIDDNILIVSAVRKYHDELNRDDYYICESSFGKIQRRYSLPDSIDTDKIDAKLSNGRLEIELQSIAKAKPRSISIK